MAVGDPRQPAGATFSLRLDSATAIKARPAPPRPLARAATRGRRQPHLASAGQGSPRPLSGEGTKPLAFVQVWNELAQAANLGDPAAQQRGAAGLTPPPPCPARCGACYLLSSCKHARLKAAPPPPYTFSGSDGSGRAAAGTHGARGPHGEAQGDCSRRE